MVTPTGDILRSKIKELQFLTSASRMLNATLNLDQLLSVTMKIVKNALDAEAVSLSVIDPEGENLVFELARGRRDKEVRGLKIPVGEGIMGWVAEHEKPLIVNDVHKDRRYSLWLEKKLKLRPRSILAIPLKRRGRLIGVLEAVNHKRREPFGEHHLALAITLGEHIAIALANSKLYDRTKRLGLEYSMLAQVSVDVGKSLSLDGVLERIIKSLSHIIPFDAAAIFVLDRKKKQIVSMLHQGYPEGTDSRINVKSDEGLVGLAARNRAGIIVDDVRKSDTYVNVRPKTRSEMIAPMLNRGRVIGLFNLESDKVGAYRKTDLRLLQAFASQASVAIERAHLYEERKEKLEIQDELRVARTIQEFFTPRKSHVFGGYRIAGVNYPSLEVSGDYYDFFPVKKGLIAFAVADVAGKGVPASLIVSSFRATLHTVAPYVASARQIALRANEILLETVRPHDFVTAFIGVLNPATGEVTYCNAGHNSPILMNPDGSYRLLETGGTVLGVLHDAPLVEGRFLLHDETLLCYTDGATEARDPKGREYGEERLTEALRSSLDLTPGRLCQSLYARLKEFYQGGRQADDVTFLCLKKK